MRLLYYSAIPDDCSAIPDVVECHVAVPLRYLAPANSNGVPEPAAHATAVSSDTNLSSDIIAYPITPMARTMTATTILIQTESEATPFAPP